MKRVVLDNPGLHILLLYSHLGIGGVQRKILDVSDLLVNSSKSVKVSIILTDTQKDSGEYHLFEPLIHPLVSLDDIGAGGYRFLKSLKYVYSGKITTIIAFQHRHGFWAVLIKYLVWWRKIRVVISTDTFTFRSIRFHQDSWKRYLNMVLVSLLFPLADLVICPSWATKSELNSRVKFKPKRCVVANNWTLMDLRHLKPKYDLLFVGRLDKVKNVSYLIDVVKLLAEKLNNVKLCIVGDGEEKSALVKLVKQKGISKNVEFAGQQLDVVKYYRIAKVFAMTSVYEAMPITILEAMSAGVPVVTTPFPGAEEFIEEGINGFIVKSKKAYAETVIKLLANDRLREKVGKRTIMLVKNSFGDKQLRRFADLALGVRQ